MDIGVEEMGFIFHGKHPLLMTRIQVRDPGPKGPLVSSYPCVERKTTLLVVSSLSHSMSPT